MENKEQCLIREEWIKAGLEELEPEEMKEFCYGLVMYGLYNEEIKSDNRMIRVILKTIYPNMDRIADKYQEKVEKGKEKKDKFKYNIWEVYQLAQKVNTMPQLVEELKKNHPDDDIKSTGLYSNKGWIDRKLSAEEFKMKYKIADGGSEEENTGSMENESKASAFTF